MNKRRKQRRDRAQHALEVRAAAPRHDYLGFILPGLPGGRPMPVKAPPETPKSRLIMPASVEKAQEREAAAAARHNSPIAQYLRAQAFVKWGFLP